MHSAVYYASNHRLGRRSRRFEEDRRTKIVKLIYAYWFNPGKGKVYIRLHLIDSLEMKSRPTLIKKNKKKQVCVYICVHLILCTCVCMG